MKLTSNEEFKLRALRRIFTIEVENEFDRIPCVTLSDSWKFVGGSVEECLDNCFMHIEKEGYRNDAQVKEDYEKGLVELSQD